MTKSSLTTKKITHKRNHSFPLQSFLMRFNVFRVSSYMHLVLFEVLYVLFNLQPLPVGEQQTLLIRRNILTLQAMGILLYCLIPLALLELRVTGNSWNKCSGSAGMYKTLVNNEIFTIAAGERRISEPSTVLLLLYMDVSKNLEAFFVLPLLVSWNSPCQIVGTNQLKPLPKLSFLHQPNTKAILLSTP